MNVSTLITGLTSKARQKCRILRSNPLFGGSNAGCAFLTFTTEACRGRSRRVFGERLCDRISGGACFPAGICCICDCRLLNRENRCSDPGPPSGAIVLLNAPKHRQLHLSGPQQECSLSSITARETGVASRTRATECSSFFDNLDLRSPFRHPGNTRFLDISPQLHPIRVIRIFKPQEKLELFSHTVPRVDI